MAYSGAFSGDQNSQKKGFNTPAEMQKQISCSIDIHSGTHNSDEKKYPRGYIMQVYRILCAVIVLSISSSVAVSRRCKVPSIQNGNFRARSKSKFRQERPLTAPVGSALPPGTSLVLRCHEGYSVQGTEVYKKEIECLDGRWTIEPVCIARRCTVPLIQNGNVEARIKSKLSWKKFGWEIPLTVPVGSVLPLSDSVVLRCDKGYSVQGTGAYKKEIQCLDGRWTIEPVCIARNCEVPLIENGYIQEGCGERTLQNPNWYKLWMCKNVTVGSLVSNNATLLLICQDGYAAKGTQLSIINIKCSKRRWSPDPVCLRIEAPSNSTTASTVPVEAANTMRPTTRQEDSSQILSTDTTPNPFIVENLLLRPLENCVCTYFHPDKNLHTVVDGRTEEPHGIRLKRGQTALLRCGKPEMHLAWPNVAFTAKSINLTCDVCQIWRKDDMPFCQTRTN